MVKHDCENPEHAHKYIDKLKATHNKTKELKGKIENLQLIQFSDSIVLALPYHRDNFSNFSSLVSDYQHSLLSSGILCRGGISYGMHHFEDDFLFSNGLIHAYLIEKDISKTPRIVISSDLINLIYPNEQDIPGDLIAKENDGTYFLKYLFGREHAAIKKTISELIPINLSPSPSIRGKQIWLIDYYNHLFPDDLIVGRPRKLSATPDHTGKVLPLCPIPNSASQSAPPFKSVTLRTSVCAESPA